MPSGTVTPPSGGAAPAVLTTTANLTSAQLKALDTTSVQLVAAPGGRKYHVLQNLVLHYRFVTTPYNENEQNALTVGFGSTVTDVITAGIILPLAVSLAVGNLFKQTADTYVSSPATTGSTNAVNYIQAATLVENKALSIAIDPSFVTPLTGGDGTLTVRVFYSTIDGAP